MNNKLDLSKRDEKNHFFSLLEMQIKTAAQEKDTRNTVTGKSFLSSTGPEKAHK